MANLNQYLFIGLYNGYRKKQIKSIPLNVLVDLIENRSSTIFIEYSYETLVMATIAMSSQSDSSFYGILLNARKYLCNTTIIHVCASICKETYDIVVLIP